MARAKASEKGKAIVVAGDVTIDWLEVGTAPDETDDAFNWRTYPGTRQIAKPGGALLLAGFVKAATNAPIISHELADIENIPPEKVVHSITALDKFPDSTAEKDNGNKVYRIKQHKGFAGPEKGLQIFAPIKRDDPTADVVVLDDPGNGFRTDNTVWPLAIKNGRKPLVIYKMSRPFSKNPLWTFLQKENAERLIIVVSGDDLRREGAKISRRLSWERTARDFVWQMSCNPHLMPLNSCAYLIVRFGVDGAILYRRRHGTIESVLFYDPKIEEDGFGNIHPGKMQGLGSAFVAAITGCLYRDGIGAIREGVRRGIWSSRLLWQSGFGNNPATFFDYSVSEIFNQPGAASITDIVIPNPSEPGNADPGFWCIANDLTKRGLENMARKYVLNGKDLILDKVPSGRFRNLVTIDRAEIESYRSIQNLIREYLDGNKSGNPLSIAVFGKPGSGKSFGVTEVAESVAPGRIERMEFNLSQFESTDDLIAAFHKVRDIALGNKVPIVFFDEFDSSFRGVLGWLKYFLSPMQDGKFMDGETIHPIGRAIFVFAGGTCSTYEEFSGESDCAIKTDGAAPAEADKAKEARRKAFKEVKGPDFVSRLRGFVNIKGPDPADGDDTRYMLRRAILLRSLLSQKAKHLVDQRGRLAIDEGILRALLKIPEYKHGVRSMTAIVEMSLLAGRKSFEQAALPSPEQLELHVNADMFCRLVMSNVLLGSERENLAKAIHATYLEDQNTKGIKGKPSLVPWGKLGEGFKESNRLQADHIPTKLNAVGCSFAPVKKSVKPAPISFTPTEIEIMAEMEHERWNSERFLSGWSYGEARDDKNLIHPNLVEWDLLPEDIKDYDRDAVRAIPAILAKAGFEIYRV